MCRVIRLKYILKISALFDFIPLRYCKNAIPSRMDRSISFFLFSSRRSQKRKTRKYLFKCKMKVSRLSLYHSFLFFNRTFHSLTNSSTKMRICSVEFSSSCEISVILNLLVTFWVFFFFIFQNYLWLIFY